MKLLYITLSLGLITAASCQNKKKSIRGEAAKAAEEGNGKKQNTDDTGPGAIALVCDNKGESKTRYEGFGDRKLGSGRIEVALIPEEADRFRIKPYEVLEAEYQRVTGLIPTFLGENATTFSSAADRWFFEPQASSITLFTTYKIGFEASLKMIENDTTFATAPTAASAKTQCTEFAEKAWDRKPSSAEVNACVQVATTDTAGLTDATRRWAHAFASVMTSAGFVAY